MTFGDVIARVVLDDPVAIHHGADSVVTGNIVIKFQSKIQSIRELFGPMDITIYLEGRAKTKIRVKHGNNNVSYHRGRAPLVAVKATVHSGPVRFESHQSQSFPFSICFPEATQKLIRDQFNDDARFETSPDAPLPPSMTCYYSGGMHKRFECFVEYRIRSEVLMPQIDVKIHSFGEEEGGHFVYYEQPRVPADIVSAAKMRTMRERFYVSNELLLPEEERPSGFREKAKAFFSSDAFPTMATDITIDGAANLLLADPITLELRIRPNTQLTTVTTELPEVQLKYVWITVKSFTQVRAEEALFGAKESEDMEAQFTLPCSVLDKRPFSKANDYTKTVTTKPLVGVPSTFSTFNITRTYVLDIEMVLLCATKDKRCKFRGIPVRILPPAQANAGDTTSGSAAAGPSAAAVVNEDEVLPSYQAPPGYEAEHAGTAVDDGARG